jgi:hypothetical protein
MSSATAVANQAERQVARPLNVLAPLIKEDLQRGDEAAKRAALPYYKAAGEKMMEAREGSFRDTSAASFWDWVKRTFDRSRFQAQAYMDLVDHERRTAGAPTIGANNFNSLREAGRTIHPHRDQGTGKTTWHEPVKQAIRTFNPEAYAKDLRNRQQERDLERKLALKRIDIGFKVLAAQLHPDKRSGSSEAMTRLNNVRNRLKQHA